MSSQAHMPSHLHEILQPIFDLMIRGRAYEQLDMAKVHSEFHAHDF